MEKLLSDDEVKKIAGRDSKVITYPDLKKYSSIPQLFGKANKIIILYLNERNGNSFIGHWVLLLRRKDKNGKEILEFNDSYSTYIDAYFDDQSSEQREMLDQGSGYLSRLLYKYCKNNPNVELHYNEFPFQKEGAGINTCGRWVGLRAHFSAVPLEKYQNLFQRVRANGHDLDKVVVDLTDELLKS